MVAAALPVIAALAALIFTIRETNNQLRIDEQGQITARYNAAITNLGSKSIDVRLGGIYALQRLMQDSPRDQPTVVAVLCAFVRDNTEQIAKPPTSASFPTTDVQAALTVIGSIANEMSTTVDLGNAQLAHAQLSKLDFRRSDFKSATLTGAKLYRANLTGANLYGANLTSADLSYADLRYADLRGANLTDANLVNAILYVGLLARANLTGAHLLGADLTSADLSGANLTRADLRYASLSGADLRGVNLSGANLTGAHLSGANLAGAVWPKSKPAPPGWARDPATGELGLAN